MPIVCAEYYFIRSLRREYFIDDTGVDVCINKMFWKNSALVSDSDRKFVKNFEKYCKLILFKSVKDCIKHTRYEDNHNSLYGFYYKKDCLCDSSDSVCIGKSLADKSSDYVHEYPIFPAENLLWEYEFCDAERLWDIHRKLVDEFNDFVDDYISKDSDGSYSKIAYIK